MPEENENHEQPPDETAADTDTKVETSETEQPEEPRPAPEPEPRVVDAEEHPVKDSSPSAAAPVIHTHVNVQRDSDAHGWQVLGTILACVAVGMLGWALKQAGWLELASTALSMFFLTLMKLLFSHGVIRKPKGKGLLKNSAPLLQKLAADYKEFIDNSPMIRLAGVAFVYTVAYLIWREAITTALTVFSNIWVAGSAAALFAAFIVAPGLISNWVSRFKSKEDN